MRPDPHAPMPTTARVSRSNWPSVAAAIGSLARASAISALPTRSGTWSGKTGPVARSARRRTSSSEFSSSCRVGTLPTSCTTVQAGSRGSCPTRACSVLPHEMPSTSVASSDIAQDGGGRATEPREAHRLCPRRGADHHGPADPVAVPERVGELEIQLRERRDVDPDDAIPAGPVQHPRNPEARHAQLGGDLALAGAVEVVAAAGQHRAQEVQPGCGRVAIEDHDG